jgi:hypothetical protein
MAWGLGSAGFFIEPPQIQPQPSLHRRPQRADHLVRHLPPLLGQVDLPAPQIHRVLPLGHQTEARFPVSVAVTDIEEVPRHHRLADARAVGVLHNPESGLDAHEHERPNVLHRHVVPDFLEWPQGVIESPQQPEVGFPKTVTTTRSFIWHLWSPRWPSLLARSKGRLSRVQPFSSRHTTRIRSPLSPFSLVGARRHRP